MSSARAKLVLTLLFLLALGAGGAFLWLERGTLLTWWYLRGLARASEEDRELWARRVAGLGEAAVPSLRASLRGADPEVCRSHATALACLLDTWTLQDPRARDLVHAFAEDFDILGAAARAEVLRMTAAALPPACQVQPSPDAVAACVRLLSQASRDQDADVLGHTLDLASALLQQPQGIEALSGAREAVRLALLSGSGPLRLRGIRLALSPGMQLYEQVALLLHDPAVEVRRAALLAVGPAAECVTDETLLPCLRDPDPEVQRLCEAALRARGLSSHHLHLGRLLVDPQPQTRLQVLDHLGQSADLDPGIWLRRLSHDPADSVRAAAVRVMGLQTLVDLRDRLDQMTHSDPSPTVSALAGYYLRLAGEAQPAH